MQALQFFDRQAAFTQLRMCINARTPFLARWLPLERGDKHFKLFDEPVTQQILAIVGVSWRRRSTELVHPRPQSGAEVRHITRLEVRSMAIAKARVSTLRFLVDDRPAFTVR